VKQSRREEVVKLNQKNTNKNKEDKMKIITFTLMLALSLLKYVNAQDDADGC
jgi:hypothetical protein